MSVFSSLASVSRLLASTVAVHPASDREPPENPAVHPFGSQPSADGLPAPAAPFHPMSLGDGPRPQRLAHSRSAQRYHIPAAVLLSSSTPSTSASFRTQLLPSRISDRPPEIQQSLLRVDTVGLKVAVDSIPVESREYFFPDWPTAMGRQGKHQSVTRTAARPALRVDRKESLQRNQAGGRG